MKRFVARNYYLCLIGWLALRGKQIGIENVTMNPNVYRNSIEILKFENQMLWQNSMLNYSIVD